MTFSQDHLSRATLDYWKHLRSLFFQLCAISRKHSLPPDEIFNEWNQSSVLSAINQEQPDDNRTIFLRPTSDDNWNWVILKQRTNFIFSFGKTAESYSFTQKRKNEEKNACNVGVENKIHFFPSTFFLYFSSLIFSLASFHIEMWSNFIYLYLQSILSRARRVRAESTTLFDAYRLVILTTLLKPVF